MIQCELFPLLIGDEEHFYTPLNKRISAPDSLEYINIYY